MQAVQSAPLAIAKLFSVAGKTVVVTGGGRGIGEMIARTFTENGASVYISSRSAETLRRTAERLSAAGPGKCTPLAEDLSTEVGCSNFARRFGELEGTDGKLHVLVNNSGIAWGESIDTFPEKQFDRVMALNVKAPFLLTRALRPFLERGSSSGDPARVINIGSITGFQHQPVPTWSYDVSKAAVHHLTRKLAAEFAPSITVNAIAPGFVPTRMSAGLLAYGGTQDDVSAGVPMGRLGAASDLGGAAVYLSSAAGAWVTGQVLVVDGGQVGAAAISMSASLRAAEPHL